MFCHQTCVCFPPVLSGDVSGDVSGGQERCCSDQKQGVLACTGWFCVSSLPPRHADMFSNSPSTEAAPHWNLPFDSRGVREFRRLRKHVCVCVQYVCTVFVWVCHTSHSFCISDIPCGCFLTSIDAKSHLAKLSFNQQ